MSPARGPAQPPAERARRSGVLASTLQEALTAIERLHTNRQTATDAATFRNQIKQLLATAHDEARRAGYDGGDVKLAVYAAVVFLDEAVLNSRLPTFAEWPRRPLQEELFGGHTGGETFFQNLHALLSRGDSDDLADVLEVYELCLLFGFKGRYAMGNPDELRAWTTAVAERRVRIRGAMDGLSPGWAPPTDEVIPVPRDVWVRRLSIAAIVVAGLVLLAAVGFGLVQQSWIAGLGSVAP
ncbi:MAG TPA: DotU family type IV/VI secretion system protein [Gemmatimonadales bacterium]|nr:DotU family type IV/VI secretion system protein [Gemmatimonadales bacterium]